MGKNMIIAERRPLGETRARFFPDRVDFVVRPSNPRVIFDSRGNKPTLSSSHEMYIEVREIIGDSGILLNVPRSFLYGTQTKEEYSSAKRKRVEAGIAERGQQYLKEHPVIACAIPNGDGISLAVVDGHHRVRYSGQFGIQEIPTLVVTPREWASVLNRKNKTSSKIYDEDMVIDDLNKSMFRTIYSFNRTTRKQLRPSDVRGINRVDHLPRVFQAA